MSGANHGSDERSRRPSEAEMRVALRTRQFEAPRLNLPPLSLPVFSWRKTGLLHSQLFSETGARAGPKGLRT